jgi:group I intron endonuclease
MTNYHDCGIYCIENLVTGYHYYGQSFELHNRRGWHFVQLAKNAHRNAHLQSSYNKHGYKNFIFKILVYCEKYELTYYEDRLEKAHRPFNYNMRECADSNLGMKMSDEFKLHCSLARKGKPSGTKGIPFTSEHKQNIAKATTGRIPSEETKQKLSKANKGHIPSRESVLKNIASHTGVPLTAEHKLSMSKARLGSVLSEEHKKKISATLTGNKMSEEAKRKMSASRKGKPSNRKGCKMSEEAKRKISASLIGKPSRSKDKKRSIESKLRMSVAQKERQARIKVETYA